MIQAICSCLASFFRIHRENPSTTSDENIQHFLAQSFLTQDEDPMRSVRLSGLSNYSQYPSKSGVQSGMGFTPSFIYGAPFVLGEHYPIICKVVQRKHSKELDSFDLAQYLSDYLENGTLIDVSGLEKTLLKKLASICSQIYSNSKPPDESVYSSFPENVKFIRGFDDLNEINFHAALIDLTNKKISSGILKMVLSESFKLTNNILILLPPDFSVDEKLSKAFFVSFSQLHSKEASFNIEIEEIRKGETGSSHLLVGKFGMTSISRSEERMTIYEKFFKGVALEDFNTKTENLFLRGTYSLLNGIQFCQGLNPKGHEELLKRLENFTMTVPTPKAIEKKLKNAKTRQRRKSLSSKHKKSSRLGSFKRDFSFDFGDYYHKSGLLDPFEHLGCVERISVQSLDEFSTPKHELIGETEEVEFSREENQRMNMRKASNSNKMNNIVEKDSSYVDYSFSSKFMKGFAESEQEEETQKNTSEEESISGKNSESDAI